MGDNVHVNLYNISENADLKECIMYCLYCLYVILSDHEKRGEGVLTFKMVRLAEEFIVQLLNEI